MTEPAPVVVTKVAATEVHVAPAEDPGNPATVGMSRLVSAFVSPSADSGPTAPVESPAAWTLLAAARREFVGARPTLDKVADPATTSLVTDVGPAAALITNSVTPEQAAITAIPQTSLLQPLQLIPVVGPLFVTPVVAVIHRVPLVGDVLHPIIGYPLGRTGGTTPRDYKIISADGTEIYVHFFPAHGVPAGTRAPTILNGPALGLPGETNPLAQMNPFLPNQVIGMAPLLDSGYNVVTWDPRGEWSSGGTLEIDNPDFEGQDMQAIISWLATQPEVELDGPGDPRLGMVGASYGGGIQLVTAAIDPRVDAIVPTIAWNDLNTSLYKAGEPKTSWGALLGGGLLLTGADANPHIYVAVVRALVTGKLSPADQAFLYQRSPDQLLPYINAPTLFIQGTVDTLFTLQEAHENAIVLIDRGVPTKVVWYCGGHGACITSENDGVVVKEATLDWLNRYVKDDPSVDTGPQFEWVDQKGQKFSSNVYPAPTGTPLEVVSEEDNVLPLRPLIGGSGPTLRGFTAGPNAGLMGFLSGSEAENAINLTVPAQTTTTYIVGAPTLEFEYSGTGTSRHVYAQLVDDSTGLVLGNQVTPIPVTLDGETHTAKVPLEMVAHTLAPGQTVTLQIVASAVEYQALWTSGRLNVTSIKLTLPTADASQINLPTGAAEIVAA
jgi:ABC-2 type transport system ATP-binding protein